MACHADDALRMIQAPDDVERSILGAFDYSENKVFLHSDPQWMPKRRAAWTLSSTGSGEGEDDPIAVSYWMNGLQSSMSRHGSALRTLVTLNPSERPAHRSRP